MHKKIFLSVTLFMQSAQRLPQIMYIVLTKQNYSINNADNYFRTNVLLFKKRLFYCLVKFYFLNYRIFMNKSKMFVLFKEN